MAKARAAAKRTATHPAKDDVPAAVEEEHSEAACLLMVRSGSEGRVPRRLLSFAPALERAWADCAVEPEQPCARRPGGRYCW
jgi:hypothetical protein